jgi:CheY-like chemotaxis protein/HPt (histidine-containing phosphotransfer) domain-containing protein
VLVVDDGAENRELASLVLAEHGLWVEEAENGKVAVDKVQETVFDLILMDMQMPVMDGYEATRTLRARGVTTPIVALTANAMKGYEAQVLAAGCTAYLTKPIDIDALLAQVAVLLGGKRAQTGAAPPPAAGTVAPAADVVNLLPAAPHENAGPIVSRLADKPRLAPIVLKFVQRLKEVVVAGRLACEHGDLEEVARIAHWMSGSAGTVGYDAFTAPARNLERLAKAGDRPAVFEAMALIEDMTARVVAPAGEESTLTK